MGTIPLPQASIFRGFLILALISFGCERTEQQITVPKEREVVSPGLDLKSRSDLESYFDSLADSKRFNGVALFAKNDSILCFSRGKRVLDGSTNELLQQGDQFQLASLSKPITSFGLLIALEKFHISVEDPVVDVLTDFPFPDITMKHLLSHSSGLGNYAYCTDSLWNKPDSFMTNGDFYEFMRCDEIPSYAPPSSHFDYCNTNYALIPIIIEHLSRISFEEFMAKEVFDPIGMVSTHYHDPFEKASNEYEVIGHYPNGDQKRPFYLDGVVGDKGVYSNVYDLYKFYLELKEPTLISRSTLNHAFAPQVTTGNGRFYGLGWRIRPVENDTLTFHNGWWRGFRSYFWMAKNQNKVAIVLTNSIRGGYLDQDAIWNLY